MNKETGTNREARKTLNRVINGIITDQGNCQITGVVQVKEMPPHQMQISEIASIKRKEAGVILPLFFYTPNTHTLYTNQTHKT
jgi:hypothetical protein